MLALAGFLLLCLAVGLSGAGVTALALKSWYPAIVHPALTPPGWLFFPAWSVVYLLSGLAAWEVWRYPDAGLRNHRALTAWGWQMGLIALWTPVFFGLHWLLPALAVGLTLLGVTALTLTRFAAFNRAAALAMLPAFFWVAFELYLNAGFWRLNH